MMDKLKDIYKTLYTPYYPRIKKKCYVGGFCGDEGDASVGCSGGESGVLLYYLQDEECGERHLPPETPCGQ